LGFWFEVSGFSGGNWRAKEIYGAAPEGPEVHYSPAQCMGAKKAMQTGRPDWKHISTSFVERQNLTMRMSMKRFARLSNGFSKKAENHEHMVAFHYSHGGRNCRSCLDVG
jgi:hypothetical protein